MRRHQHERVAGPLVPGDDVIEELQELTSILVIAKDRLPGHTASHDVVRRAGHLETRRTRHASNVVAPWRLASAGAAFVTMSRRFRCGV
jgi:hypothetical protein